MAVHVDNPRRTHPVFASGSAIGEVRVAMQPEARLGASDQVAEGNEAAVTGVRHGPARRHAAEPCTVGRRETWRGMADHEVRRTVPPDSRTVPKEPERHRPLAVLLASAIVEGGAAKAKEPQTLPTHEPPIESEATCRRSLPVAAVMITKHVEQRGLQVVGQETQIVGGKVTTGDHGRDSCLLPARLIIGGVQQRINNIAYCQDPHASLFSVAPTCRVALGGVDEQVVHVTPCCASA